MTTSITIISGVVIFVLGQIILKSIIEPSLDLKKSISSLSGLILLNHSKITNASIDNQLAYDLKIKTTDIIAKTSNILFFTLTSKIFQLPSKNNIILSAKKINSICYSLKKETRDSIQAESINGKKTNFPFNNSISLDEISKLLKIKTSFELWY